MNIILLLTTYTNAGEGEDGDAGRSHKERTKELKTVKEPCMQCLLARRSRAAKADMKKMNNHIREKKEEKSEVENVYINTFSSMIGEIALTLILSLYMERNAASKAFTEALFRIKPVLKIVRR